MPYVAKAPDGTVLYRGESQAEALGAAVAYRDANMGPRQRSWLTDEGALFPTRVLHGEARRVPGERAAIHEQVELFAGRVVAEAAAPPRRPAPDPSIFAGVLAPEGAPYTYEGSAAMPPLPSRRRRPRRLGG